ncbi:MAG: hypothetical protein AAFU54_22775 [Chloroflexota bacterium]
MRTIPDDLLWQGSEAQLSDTTGKRSFGMDDYEAIRADMLDVLKQVAAHGDTVSYSEFGRMLQTPLHHRNPALYNLLRDICYDEREAGRPNLCALVVRKSDGMPGQGFFTYGGLHGDEIDDPRTYWEAKVRECWEYYRETPTENEDTA